MCTYTDSSVPVPLVRFHGHDLAPGQDQLLREACLGLLKGRRQRVSTEYDVPGFDKQGFVSFNLDLLR